MKKQLILMAFMAMVGIAGAQMTTTHYVYIPGDGEHRLGFVLGPGFGQKSLYVGDKDTDPDKFIPATSSLGFTAGLRWGYETEWGRTVGFGNFMALLYTFQPFSGQYTDISSTSHTVKYTGQCAHLYESPNLTIDISDELKLSLGVGLDLRFTIPGKAKIDGVKMAKAEGDETGFDILETMILLSAGFDANVGCKYFLTEDFYVGARLQYNFYTLSLYRMMAEDSDDLPKNCAGIVNVDLDKNYATTLYLNDPQPVQLMFEIGYRW